MLVLCEDGEHHAAVESVIALCCSDRHADASDARPSKGAGAAANDCSGSCTDTPLLTSIAATFPKSVAPVDGPSALSQSFLVAVAPLCATTEQDAGFSGSRPPPHLVRSTVLRV
jgi:hypothetical protein